MSRNRCPRCVSQQRKAEVTSTLGQLFSNLTCEGITWELCERAGSDSAGRARIPNKPQGMALPPSKDHTQGAALLMNDTALAANGVGCLHGGGAVPEVTTWDDHRIFLGCRTCNTKTWDSPRQTKTLGHPIHNLCPKIIRSGEVVKESSEKGSRALTK